MLNLRDHYRIFFFFRGSEIPCVGRDAVVLFFFLITQCPNQFMCMSAKSIPLYSTPKHSLSFPFDGGNIYFLHFA